MNPAIIAAIAEQLRAELGDDFDDVTFLDTLDGETNFLDWLDGLLADSLEADALHEAIGAQLVALKARQDRIDMRRESFRRAALTLLRASGQ